jgi:hypothetical protein
MNDPEEIPPDPYTSLTQLKIKPNSHETKVSDDKFKRFLEYDGKVLRYIGAHKSRQLTFHTFYTSAKCGLLL